MFLLLITLFLVPQGVLSQIYDEPPSYRGYDLNCTVCQGTVGDPCDVSPEDLPHIVPCRGSCVVWRTLYSTGRASRTIYRGCENTIFPTLLPEKAKDACVYDHFFVSCTTLCEGHQCNQNGTGMPPCWDCQGEFRPCDIEPETNCTDPITTTAPPFTWLMDCVSCTGGEGDACEVSPHKIPYVVKCNDTCVSWRTISTDNRTMLSVWRGCKDTLFPGVLHPEALDSCDHSNPERIQCTVTCSSPLCNKYSSGAPSQCWTDKAELKEECQKEKQYSENPYLNNRRHAIGLARVNETRNGTNLDMPIWGSNWRARLGWFGSSATSYSGNMVHITQAIIFLLFSL